MNLLDLIKAFLPKTPAPAPAAPPAPAPAPDSAAARDSAPAALKPVAPPSAAPSTESPSSSGINKNPSPSPGSIAKAVAIAAGSVGIRVDHLVRMGASQSNAEKYCPYLNEACARFQINTNARICGFIAQILVESAYLSATAENLNYTVDGILRVRPSWSRAYAQQVVAGGPQAIGNAMYSGMLGNSAPGDGYKYRGRGLIQLTGKGNYAEAGASLGMDLVGNPDLVIATPENCVLTAADFYARRGCVQLSDPDTLAAVRTTSIRINGGTNGMDARLANWTKAKSVFADLK